MSYGKCPVCGGEGNTRERRIGGNDTCVNGHTYTSASAITNKKYTIKLYSANGMLIETYHKCNAKPFLTASGCYGFMYEDHLKNEKEVFISQNSDFVCTEN